MTSRLTLSLLLCLGLAACAPKPVQHPTPPNMNRAIDVTLTEAAKSVSHSLTNLEATEQAAYPPKSVAPPPPPSTYGMDIPASVNWQGPIEPILKQLAAMSSYKISTVGRPPSLPIIVSIHTNNEAIGTILRKIGLQSAKRAQVIVMPHSKTIEVR